MTENYRGTYTGRFTLAFVQAEINKSFCRVVHTGFETLDFGEYYRVPMKEIPCDYLDWIIKKRIQEKNATYHALMEIKQRYLTPKPKD
jgi:hypothetical protein